MQLIEPVFGRTVLLTPYRAKSGDDDVRGAVSPSRCRTGPFELRVVPPPELRPAPITVLVSFPTGLPHPKPPRRNLEDRSSATPLRSRLHSVSGHDRG